MWPMSERLRSDPATIRAALGDRPVTYRVLVGEPNTPEWLRGRKCGIGASEAAAILGDTNWGTPLTIWQDKTSPDIRDIGTDRMRWGHRMEPVILEAIREDYPEYGAVVPSEGLLQSIEYPWLLGTLDAMLDTTQYGLVPLEIKNVSAYERKLWFDEFGLPRVPAKYTVQVRQQAFIRDDAPGGYVAALFDGNELVLIWVPRSEEFIDRHLIGTLGDFWNRNVLGGIAPDPILGDDLAELWPADPLADAIEAGETFLEMRDRWIDAKGREKQAKGDIESLKFYFGVFFETHTLVTENGRPVMKMPERAGAHRVKVATHEAHHPDCSVCVTQDNPSRSPQAVIQKQGQPS